MSVRLLAQDLYRFQTEVERLEKELAAAPLEKKAVIERSLHRARVQKERLRRALDGRLERTP
jgi:hypothetical protein